MDRVGLGLSWAAGISLCVVAATIVGYMAYKGLQYVTFDMITQSPEASLDQSSSGGSNSKPLSKTESGPGGTQVEAIAQP